MAAVAASGVVLVVLPLVAAFLIGPSYPTLKVTGLMVSNATWEATLLAERLGTRGTYLFKQVECFLYYSWDAARPFAVAHIVIEATMRTWSERSEEEEEAEAEASVIRKMNLEQRCRGMVVVGLGLRMLGTTEFGPWFKGDYVLIEARCNHLSIAFANSSSTEGSLITGINVGGNPSDNLPSCSFQ
ncbi:hypothetical protein ACJRO7_032436 [Eucalyptus globulus]|uniref:Uncharacterized protein n=1 Tax=Eucalyptus globulus TaxID=34317 RepID=A0ABD3JHX7_EUCGL